MGSASRCELNAALLGSSLGSEEKRGWLHQKINISPQWRRTEAFQASLAFKGGIIRGEGGWFDNLCAAGREARAAVCLRELWEYYIGLTSRTVSYLLQSSTNVFLTISPGSIFLGTRIFACIAHRPEGDILTPKETLTEPLESPPGHRKHNGGTGSAEQTDDTFPLELFFRHTYTNKQPRRETDETRAIRPQMAKEKIEGCHICTSVTPGEPQVLLGKDKAFTYDFVFDIEAEQQQIYAGCVHKLIEGCFDGYNATVFAYGQTGSGKTYTMGTGFDVAVSEEERGIIPRAVHQLFQGIQKRRLQTQSDGITPPDFKVTAQFLELYNEEILDLFDSTRDPEARGRKSNIKIHEDGAGGIYTTGVTSRLVSSEEELLQCLKLGALSRTTASTQMNAQSSRSHAIFTIQLCQMRVCPQAPLVNGEMSAVPEGSLAQPEYETLSAKFHFVDLAGSERLKRTGATGERAREGISINCGLVCSHYGFVNATRSKKAGHVPYRDSKLTRLLQDSLGGNSRTVMIACVSPSDRDFMETLNTLKYANRARNIKNKVTVNQDKTSQQISSLRAEIARLQMEIMEYKAVRVASEVVRAWSDEAFLDLNHVKENGKRVACEDGSEAFSDLFQENSLLQRENETLRMRVKAMQETIDHLNTRVSQLLTNGVNLLLTKTGETNEEIGNLIQNYIREIEELRSKLLESEAMNESLRRSLSRLSSRSPFPVPPLPLGSSPSVSLDTEMTDVIRQAKLDVERLRKKERNQRRKSPEKEKGLKKRAKLLSEENGEKIENEERRENGDGDSDNEPEEDGMYSLQEDDHEESGCDEEEEEEEEETREEEEFDMNLQADLADLTCEIEIKQRLIDELENSQRRLLTLKNQYEEKLILLQNKIRDTQLERDRVLHNLMSMENYTEEKASRIRIEYEKRLKEMNRDLMKLQAAQKEHSRLLKNQGRYERELKKLQSELNTMKKAKVALMKQMKEEQQKRRMIDAKRNREIAQLKKEQRRQEYQIRALESQKHQQELVLRRRTQEVTALRRMAKPMSERASGRLSRRLAKSNSPPDLEPEPEAPERSDSSRSVSSIIRHSSRRKLQRKSASSGSSCRTARQKWQSLEKRIMDIVMQRMTITNVEADMDRLIKKREELSVQQEALLCKREKLLNDCFPEQEEHSLLQEISEELEVINANMDYISDSLSDCQATIVQIEESKDELDSVDMSVVISSCSLSEARSLLQFFLKASIDKGLQVAQKEAQVRLLEGQLRQTDVIGSSQNHMILDALREKAECIPELQALIHNVQQENGYVSTDEEVSEFSQASEGGFSQMKQSASHEDFKMKVEPRLSVQMKAVSAEFLGPVLDLSSKNITKSLASLSEIHENGLFLRESYSRELVSRTISLPIRGHTFPRQSRGPETSPLTRRQSYDRGPLYRSPDVGYTPPPSPPLRLRNDRNVFSRLTSHQSQGSALDKSDDSDSSLSEVLSISSSSHTMLTCNPITISSRAPELPRVPGTLESTNVPRIPSILREPGSLTAPASLGLHKPDGAHWRPISFIPNSCFISASLGRRDELSEAARERSACVFSTSLLRYAPSFSPWLRSITNLTRDSLCQLSVNITSTSSGISGAAAMCVEIAVSVEHQDVCAIVGGNRAGGRLPRQKIVCFLMGVITPTGGVKGGRTAPLQCVAMAEGHTKPVLCLDATDELLFTGSKDRTCKMWNLDTGQEIVTLRGHPNNVVSVKYCSRSNLVFTVSTSFIKVWDIRDSAKCVRTFTSSGQVVSGDACAGTTTRTITTAQGEQQINQIALNPSGSALYAAAGNTVRTWDLGRMQASGKLTGHIGSVMCLTIFDVAEAAQGNVGPAHNFEPPHYDGIECLVVHGNVLFSGSRDNGIKKWDLGQQELIQQIPNAHKDWVCALALVPGRPMLLSACRGGMMKLWNMDNFSPIGEIKGHDSPINALCANSRQIFTASSDCRVKLWSSVEHCLPRRLLAIKGRATSLP
ncbi:hypothetical protein DNTS_004984 [Danionella cerebrum]|uniref:Kinesin motor domain-containing protein n=1 Tax=Danionella cerebrum TaxID=2873325 RepID=A0A553RLB9_9TELE|nr:hypothetical protein DNTS_004984 [Danionella translucida]